MVLLCLIIWSIDWLTKPKEIKRAGQLHIKVVKDGVFFWWLTSLWLVLKHLTLYSPRLTINGVWVLKHYELTSVTLALTEALSDTFHLPHRSEPLQNLQLPAECVF